LTKLWSTSHSTQNRSFSELFPKRITWLGKVGMEKTKPNTIEAHTHQSKEMYNTK